MAQNGTARGEDAAPVLELVKLENGNWGVPDIRALPHPAGEPAEFHAARAGLLDNFAETEIVGVPVGGALIGGGVALLADALVDRFSPPKEGDTGTVAKLVGAAILAKYGGRLVGDEAARWGAAFMVWGAAEEKVTAMLDDFITKLRGDQDKTPAPSSGGSTGGGTTGGGIPGIGPELDMMIARDLMVPVA